jgi:hypothetical protein
LVIFFSAKNSREKTENKNSAVTLDGLLVGSLLSLEGGVNPHWKKCKWAGRWRLGHVRSPFVYL